MIPETREKLTFAGGILIGGAFTVALILLAAIFGGCVSTSGQLPYTGPEFHQPYVQWFMFVGDTSRREHKFQNEDPFDRRIDGVLWIKNPTNFEERVTVACRTWGTTPIRDMCIQPKRMTRTQILGFERDRLDPDLCHIIEHSRGCR